jgi:hypothetical protein
VADAAEHAVAVVAREVHLVVAGDAHEAASAATSPLRCGSLMATTALNSAMGVGLAAMAAARRWIRALCTALMVASWCLGFATGGLCDLDPLAVLCMHEST